MNLGRAMRITRLLRDIKQRDLALRLAISEQRVSKLETGRVSMMPHLELRIAKALDISVELLEFLALTPAERASIAHPDRRRLMQQLTAHLLKETTTS